jgi:hypothetical protein
MIRYLFASCACVVLTWPTSAQADVVTDWNKTLNDAIIATPTKHNPGNPTRAMAMMNAAIYDVFQAINRTHAPFKVNEHAPGANLDAAVAQAAFRVISETYSEQQSTLNAVLATRLGSIIAPNKQAGIDLGNLIATHYINAHANDGWDQPDSYTPTVGPGHWASDPLHPGQKGWGKAWGTVSPWVMQNSDQFDAQFPVMGIPAFGTQAYRDAFQQVKDYGARTGGLRTPGQTAIGLFWAYDRPNLPLAAGVGPPPVLFIENLTDIAAQVGNTPAENARLFALASVSMADAAIAAWDVKFETDYWRPITAIRADAANDDDDPLTIEDPNWVYLGAPGSDPGSSSDDFTPPFPAYTSGHATMGGAVFKSLELFYKTNVYDQIDGIIGNDLDYVLHSNEAGGGGTRSFDKFTQTVPLTVGTENSPEGENAISRIYLGIHWLFDARDGTKLGNLIAEYAATNHFQAVPEPGAVSLTALAALLGIARSRRRHE